jgi:hypothetical protein
MKPSRGITRFHILNRQLLFQINSLSGTLFSCNPDRSKDRGARVFTPKIQKALERCESPYLLSAPADETQRAPSPPLAPEAGKRAIHFGDWLMWLSRRQFFCARLYASWRVPLFATAREAILFFRQHAEGDQEELCLARALFAAKTSRRFAEEGAVVIGVFLPSRAMHAWVIEGDEMADPYDGIWINYQPVAMLS